MFRMEMELGKLFIGGISWDTNEDRLREYFQAFGEVVEAVIMKDRATGRARGFGFVVFADPAIAERVVMEKHMIDGRTVEAKKAVPRDDQNILNKSNVSIHGSPGPARTKKIFVGGLASTVTESDFKRYFDQFGTITDVVVMYDHNTQRPRGFGFITYDSEEAVDKVLQRTFHELNGKMVEVKRAVPKESSPGTSRNQLGGYNFGLSRVNSFLNGYMQGYNTSSVGGYGVRMEGRFSPVTVGRSGFPPLSPGYGMGLNFESNLSPSYGGSLNLSSNLSYGRGLNTSFNGNSNRFGSPFGYGGGSGGNSSILNSAGRNMWGNGSFNYATSSTNSSAIVGSGSGNSGVRSFGSIGALWDSSPSLGQGGGAASSYNGGNLRYGSGEFGVGSGGIGYGRNSNVAQLSSHGASNGGYDGAYADIYENGSFYGDSTWRSSPSDLERSSSFGFGLGDASSDVMTNNSAGYIGGYSVTNRQANRGIAA
ncbi:heterogeneous nuclear ribonucleoprotein 1 isoform X1 [Herrania umbratica]|uniref:Heterogeneous nuclear ribonucleoprotein 1 isoform X1 n=2 Tax=Herrania umbratica TaxID=108875 RepID=A0A6J1B7D2_9ROSI|nr:heterogeneous nuclear ribonucleoprotein 1 isoform X1 [Herrania umbratica]XP_021295093.1 heterogeneous nuclear ribonucleoprotein 1 isoform X1 [Herrania umbratica]XP_021295095.1 heterogeneous nuclear ribonucleoprotein 1 isoform X1 [Herrania umbratica]XP_021295096.1 heterogeneous nuclear ribonucleoprotein 1 isoform X1 [Herrania umbratica]